MDNKLEEKEEKKKEEEANTMSYLNV